MQIELLRAMSPEQRLLLAIEMSEFARELAKDGIRRDHPEWPESRVIEELIRLAFFPEQIPLWLEKRFQTRI